MRLTVIVLGADSPIGLAVIRDLGRAGVKVIGVGWGRRAVGLHSRYCTVPVLRAKREDALIGQLREITEAHDAKFLLVVGESDIELVNRHRKALETFITPLVPESRAMARVNCKESANRIAAEIGLKVPRTIQLPPGTDDKEIARAMVGLTFPVILKWSNPLDVTASLRRHGIDLEKCEYARDPVELRRLLEKYRPVGAFPLIQEYCAGHGIGHFFLVRDGRILMEFQHERLQEIPPEGGVASLCRSLAPEKHAACLEKSRALVQALDWQGVAMVEYRYDPVKNDYWFMEVNGRFWGSLPLAITSGVPFAWGLVKCCGLGEDPPAYAAVAGRMCRYFIPDAKRLARILFQPHQIRDPLKNFSRRKELFRFLRLYLDPRVRYFVFKWSDPKPFLVDGWYVLKKLFGRKPPNQDEGTGFSAWVFAGLALWLGWVLDS